MRRIRIAHPPIPSTLAGEPAGSEKGNSPSMASVLRLLSNSWVVLGLTALLVFYILIAALVNYRKLRQFKGPPFAAFSRWWLFWEECRARLPHSQFAVIEKYGTSSFV